MGVKTPELGDTGDGGKAHRVPRVDMKERAVPGDDHATVSPADVSDGVSYPDSTYLNFTSMHGIRTIVSRVKQLAAARILSSERPPASYFKAAAEVEDPSLGLECRELPFAVYLITGNAGSGKSTCLQTLSEVMDCVITGTTKVAAQNVYSKLSAAYSSQHVNTIFHEFGFRGNHVQAVLGKWHYACRSNPPSVAELQKRDLTYYWEVLSDITRARLKANDSEKIADAFAAARAAEDALGKPRGSLSHCAFSAHGSIPAFARTNVIVVDEAGLLGRYFLAAIVYSWWLVNAMYDTPQYAACMRPVVICVGSPTQTSSLESTFEHSRLKCSVRTSENVLTFIICNRTLRTYLNLPQNWAIFINNKRCTEPEFGDLLKSLEYGLPITEEHARMADNFVVPEAFINNPANLPGWTRLYASHKEVSAYMARLHAHLKVSGDERFTVFTLPSYTLVRLPDFEEYRKAANQPGLTIERWLTANAGRLSNWSQSRDQDAVHSRCEIRSDVGLAVACSDVTYVLNSQVAVTTRLKKWVFGFCDTFEGFMAVLKDDSFVKTQGEGSVEYAYRFLAHILFSGLINFYDFLLDPHLPAADVDVAYARLAEVTKRIVPGMADEVGEKDVYRDPATDNVMEGVYETGDPTFDYSRVGKNGGADDEDDVIFSALSDRTVDMLYCNYDFGRPETPAEVHAQFAMLKSLFSARYAALSEIFGRRFCESRFDSYVDNVTFKRGEMFAHNMRGGMLSLALQTDSYTLIGYTGAKIHAFSDESARRRLGENMIDALQELRMPSMVLKDQRGFMSVINVNVNEFVDTVEDKELKMAVTADYGLSSKLSMTIARSQGLSLDKVAICFPRTGLRLNTVYVAMSRVVSSEYLRTNINPLRESYTRDDTISEYILSALRDPSVHIVY